MTLTSLHCGFMSLVDCAPLVVAKEIGFAAEENLDLQLHREVSWATLRDKLATGRYAAAHLLSPIPIATSLGLGGLAKRLDVLSVLSVNGLVIGVAPELAQKMRQSYDSLDFMDAGAVGRCLISVADKPLRIGVPFPISMHAELLYYWLGSHGLSAPQELDVRTIPPTQIVDAMAAHEVDAFCAGPPWGSVAVEAGVAELVLPGCAIWRFSPEKVLAVRHDWAESEVELTGKLMRSVWRAGRWLADTDNRLLISEILARAAYLDMPAETIERSLAGRLVVSPDGQERDAPGFMEFFDCSATFPWRSQAQWIASRLAARIGMDRGEASNIAQDCFRPDLYRANLGPIGAALPAASAKIEGALSQRTLMPSTLGTTYLGPDTFFDGEIFDPV